jgi:hypothetical protein
MVNNYGNTQRVTIMARKSSADEIWNDIFDNLILDNEPPFEYIKNVLITTKSGVRLRVSAVDFSHILERERFLTPDESDILSCKLAINFDKVRRDVDEWADQAMYYFDHAGKFKPVTKKTAKKKATSTAKTTRKTVSKTGKDEPAAVAKTLLDTSKTKASTAKTVKKSPPKSPRATGKKS